MENYELLTVLRVNKNRVGNIVSYTCRVGNQTKNFSYEQLLKYIMSYNCVNARAGADEWYNDARTPFRFVVVFVNRERVIIKVHNHINACVPANWEYITVKRGELRGNEKRFMVTTTDGKTFEPDETAQIDLHYFLVFECNVFYQYKTVKDVDNVIEKVDSQDPLYNTYYYFNSKQSDSNVYTLRVLKKESFLVERNARYEGNMVRLSANDLYSLGSWTKKMFPQLKGTEEFHACTKMFFLQQPI